MLQYFLKSKFIQMMSLIMVTSVSLLLVNFHLNITTFAQSETVLWQIGKPDGAVSPVTDGADEYPTDSANPRWTSVFHYNVGNDSDPINHPNLPGYLSTHNVCDIDPNRPCTDATEEIQIHFTLMCDYGPGALTLTYDRYGSENDSFYWDNVTPYFIQGSEEGGFGTFSFNNLGMISKGNHTIKIRYQGGGDNNGHYIDYLRLVATAPCATPTPTPIPTLTPTPTPTPEPKQFQSQQSLSVARSFSSEYFDIDGTQYLAVASYDFNNYSKIYTWDGAQFVHVQNILTSRAADWEYFNIGTDHFLAVANYRDAASFTTDSEIYRWNNTLNQFEPFQTIETDGANHWTHFTIGTDHFLVVAQSYDGVSHTIDSKIYKWDGSSNQFVVFQSVQTHTAHDWVYFQIGADHYLAVANYLNDPSASSEIYKWNTNSQQFDLFQSINTTGATDWEYFEMNGKHYLAVANWGPPVNRNSQVYEWTGNSFIEQPTMAIPTSGVMDLRHFVIDSEHYMVVANQYNGTSSQIDSTVYQWDGASFVPFQNISTNASTDWEYFTINGEHYLAVTNDYGWYVNIVKFE